MRRPRRKYKRNEFAFYKDDQAWKWDVDNELSPTDIRELGHSCTSGKLYGRNFTPWRFSLYRSVDLGKKGSHTSPVLKTFFS